MAAPAFADLDWTQLPTGGWLAEGTSAFWDHYNLNRGAFKALGFSVNKPASKWIVTGPDIDDTNRASFRDLLAGIHAQLSAARDRQQAALAAKEARDDAWRQRRSEEARAARAFADAQAAEARALRHSKIVAEAKAAGQACMDKWGTLVHRKATLADLVAKDLLAYAQVRLIHSLVSETERKAAALTRKAAGVRDDDCVNWTDNVVERAVRHMTGLDSDHAQDPNEVGWGPQHSPTGHWCVAMLKTDRDAALRTARTIVGHYRGQLSAILTPQEMP
jgi:hypothetical protein